jgi:hypothetical protein
MLGMAKVANLGNLSRELQRQILQELRGARIVQKFHRALENLQSKRSDLRAKLVGGQAESDHRDRELKRLPLNLCADNVHSYLFHKDGLRRLGQLKLVRHIAHNGCATYAS